jgi:Flp pilus assembly protein TadB
MIKHSMNKLFLLCICATALAGSLFAQVPTETPIASATAPTAATAATAATSIAAPASTAASSATSSSASTDLAARIHRKLEKKLGHKHGIIIDGDDKDEDADLQQMRNLVAIPIVAIVFLSIFGAPVAIVVMIGIISLIATRMRQRTIRMMVEKGQPVPAELLVPATRGLRRRSDVRRGVVWTMVGFGLMIWLAAVNDWEGGAWSFGLIPFLIGLGYLIVWKLENKKDIPPPPPAP